MYQHFVFDPALTKPDLLVLQNLVQDVKDQADHKESVNAVVDNVRNRAASVSHKSSNSRDELTIQQLEAFNNPQNKNFEPTVFVLANFDALHIPDWIDQRIIQPYIKWARTVARVDTDVVMVSHLLLYFTTSVPSAFYLFHHFSWTHAILHFIMQMYYVGTYTLIKHQHIHQGGLLSKNWSAVDTLFPYLLDPLFGHSWNSYYYHHVKHHHVEGNGPNDLSSTIEYQRDDIFNLLHYIFRFYFLIWLDLPLYFIRTRRPKLAFKTAFWDISTYLSIYTLATRVNFRATLFVFILPLAILRLGLMMGNWGQHAFIDELEPDSDFRSSITLIDVQSNRFCFNDGYHTSHHLNPLRHWRDHPVSFMKQKQRYADEHALVFSNIDYMMITIRLMMKDYDHLAKCLVPISDSQMSLTLDERADLLRRKTKAFSKEEIKLKFKST